MPSLPLKVLGLLELKQDSFFSEIEPKQIPMIIQEAIRYGEQIASKVPGYTDLQSLLKRLLKQKVRVSFQEKPPSALSTRARYWRKEKRIEIYRSSLKQLESFFSQWFSPIHQDDLIALHLFHEYFHHLEETKYGRTDEKMPKVVVKAWGPWYRKQTISRTREIAAHAFTQKCLGLSWSPLLLDQLIYHLEQGKTRSAIREYFQVLREEYERFSQPEPSQEELAPE
jgi:hypothetical protein